MPPKRGVRKNATTTENIPSASLPSTSSASASASSTASDSNSASRKKPAQRRSEIEILVADQNLAPLDRKIKRVAAKEPKDYADVKARVKKGAVATKTSAKKDVKSTASKTKRIKESARKEVKKKN